MQIRLRNILLTLGLSIVVTFLFIATLYSKNLRERCYENLSYYLISLLVIAWGYSFWDFLRYYKSKIKSHLKPTLAGLVIAIVLTKIIFISVQPTARVLNDEVNLLGVARSMTLHRQVRIVDEAVRYYGMTDDISGHIDKRPLLFPFLISVVHTVLGYRVENVFVLNFLILLAMLFLVYVVFRRYGSAIAAAAFLLLIVSHPIVSLTATSGMFDLCFTAFLVLSLVSLWFFVRNPSEVSLRFVWINFLMFINIRYEGCVYFAVAGLLLLVFGYLKREYLRNFWFYILTGFSMFPLLWQRLLIGRDPQLPQGESMFSLGHFIDNNLLILKSMLRFDFKLPYATILIYTGLVAAFYLLYRIIRSGRLKDKNILFIFVAGISIFISSWVVITSYYWSNFDDAVCSRFYIPFCVLFSVLTAAGLSSVCSGNQKCLAAALLVSAFLFLLYHPIAMEDRVFKVRKGYTRDYRLANEYMKQFEGRDVQVISFYPKRFIIHNLGGIRFGRANDEFDTHLYRLRHRLYEDIYVVQEIDYDTRTPGSKYRLSKEYQLEPVYESQNRNGRFIRISKVINER